jgi:hypothetical protein
MLTATAVHATQPAVGDADHATSHIVAARSTPRPVSKLAMTPREAVKHYERHVLAWYALGRATQARATRAAITRTFPACPSTGAKTGKPGVR